MQATRVVPAAVSAACNASVRALAGVYAEVEGGQMEDHPKLTALRKTLVGFKTITPVCPSQVDGLQSFTAVNAVMLLAIHEVSFCEYAALDSRVPRLWCSEIQRRFLAYMLLSAAPACVLTSWIVLETCCSSNHNKLSCSRCTAHALFSFAPLRAIGRNDWIAPSQRTEPCL